MASTVPAVPLAWTQIADLPGRHVRASTAMTDGSLILVASVEDESNAVQQTVLRVSLDGTVVETPLKGSTELHHLTTAGDRTVAVGDVQEDAGQASGRRCGVTVLDPVTLAPGPTVWIEDPVLGRECEYIVTPDDSVPGVVWLHSRQTFFVHRVDTTTGRSESIQLLDPPVGVSYRLVVLGGNAFVSTGSPGGDLGRRDQSQVVRIDGTSRAATGPVTVDGEVEVVDGRLFAVVDGSSGPEPVDELDPLTLEDVRAQVRVAEPPGLFEYDGTDVRWDVARSMDDQTISVGSTSLTTGERREQIDVPYGIDRAFYRSFTFMPHPIGPHLALVMTAEQDDAGGITRMDTNVFRIS